VYSLDADRILRVPRSDALAYAVGKAQLCDEFRDQVPFTLPRLLDSGTVDDTAYTIEERIPGRSLDVALVDLEGTRREEALLAYAGAALALNAIAISRPWFGEFLMDPTIRRDTWSEYLIARAAVQFARAAERLREVVADIGSTFATFRDQLGSLDGAPVGLVHGDLFPGNVMVDDDLRVTGVIDFGFSTVIGDPRLDLVAASAFLEVDRPWNRPGDADIVRGYLGERVVTLSDVNDLYRRYIALYFSFTHEFHLPLYDWAVTVLNSSDAARRAGDA
jgi:fructosamine-3-kinase